MKSINLVAPINPRLPIALFIVLSCCKKVEMFMANSAPIIQLPPFGFDSGGFIEISGEINTSVELKVLFIASGYAFHIPRSFISISSLCRGTYSTNNDDFIVTFNSSSSFQYYRRIQKAKVYHPYIFNCDGGPSRLHIRAIYGNPNSRIDSRDSGFPDMLRVFSFLHIVSVMIWFVNGLSYPTCKIYLHTVLSILPLIKAFALFRWSQYTELQKVSDLQDYPGGILSQIFDISYNTIFLCSFALVCSGWCIFRNEIKSVEFLNITFASLVIVISAHFLNCIETVFGALFFLGLLIFGVFWYIKICIIYIIMMARIQERTKDNNPISLKILLSQEYAKCNVNLFLATFSLCCLLSMCDFPRIWVITSQELGFYLSGVGSMVLFLIRKQYLGTPEQYNFEPPRKKVNIPRILADPNSHVMVFLSREY